MTIAKRVVATQPALDVDRVTKRFRTRRVLRRNGGSETSALDDVSFQIERGEIFGVLGANGSGKSTLIRVISTLLVPDSGTVRVFGFDTRRDEAQVKRLINRVSVEAAFFKKLSATENLLYSSRLYGRGGVGLRRDILAILEKLGLDATRAGQPLEELSRGMQQKVAIARAFLTSPILLLLDEPTTGLDPRSKQDVQRFVMKLRDEQSATIVLCTHDMDEAERLCDRIAVLDQGRIVALDTADGLKRRVAGVANLDEITMESVFISLTGRAVDDAAVGDSWEVA